MARAIGINHVALEVGDIEAAVAFYRSIFGLPERGRAPGMAFLDMGDQFLALSERRSAGPDEARHFGLVVDDKEAVREALEEVGIRSSSSRRLDFHDPWGNFVEVVDYRDIQFTKDPAVLRGMGVEDLRKHDAALAELRAKGLVD
jgi:lactoylglutathione lyase